jgi:hypothetical protein
MEPKLAQQLDSIIRMIVRDELRSLINEPSNNENILIQIDYSKTLNRKTISDKIGWLKGETTLRAFYNSLVKYKSVSCDFNLFRTHFAGTEQPQAKIVWQANLNELVYLFARLREEGIIPMCKNPHLLLQEIFLDRYQKTLNSGSLKTLLEKGIRNDKRMEVIERIINDVLAQKSF